MNARHVSDGDAVEVGVSHADVHALEGLDPRALLLAEKLRLSSHIHFEKHPQDDQGQDDAHDGQRIRRRIRQSRQGDVRGVRMRGKQRLLSGSERRSVGGGPGKEA
jgi:hypothetical protein